MATTNTCEHGDHPAPEGKRFCSKACAKCEHESVGLTGCDEICGGDGGDPFDLARRQPKSKAVSRRMMFQQQCRLAGVSPQALAILRTTPDRSHRKVPHWSQHHDVLEGLGLIATIVVDNVVFATRTAAGEQFLSGVARPRRAEYQHEEAWSQS